MLFTVVGIGTTRRIKGSSQLLVVVLRRRVVLVRSGVVWCVIIGCRSVGSCVGCRGISSFIIISSFMCQRRRVVCRFVHGTVQIILVHGLPVVVRGQWHRRIWSLKRGFLGQDIEKHIVPTFKRTNGPFNWQCFLRPKGFAGLIVVDIGLLSSLVKVPGPSTTDFLLVCHFFSAKTDG